MGPAFFAASLPLACEQGTLAIHGRISKPTYLQGRPSNQYIFVNGRFARDKVIAHAVKEAYKDVLHHAVTPEYALFLTLPPIDVDVNVSPTKSEVRFRHSQIVHQFVAIGLAQTIAGTTRRIPDRNKQARRASDQASDQTVRPIPPPTNPRAGAASR